MICTHRIYKGEDAEIVVREPEEEYSNLSIYFYTQGGEKVEATAYAISGGLITCAFEGDELDILPDGVIRYDLEYDVDGAHRVESVCTDLYLATPGGYSALTPDDYFMSGYTAGYEAAQAKSVNLTQAEYDNLEEKDCSVYYNIVEE